MSGNHGSGSRRFLLAAALGVAVLPAVFLLRLAIGLVLGGFGSSVDAVHLLLAPVGGLGGYLAGVAVYRLLTFLFVAALAIAWSWRRWSARPALVTGGVALAAGILVAALGVRGAVETGERARAVTEESRRLIEGSLAVEGLEAEVRPEVLRLALPVTVRRSGSYRFHLRWDPADSDDPDVANRGFVFDTVLALEPGGQRLPIRIEADALTGRWGMLWRWSEDGSSEVELTVGLLLDVAELEEMGGADLAEIMERIRASGARAEDLEALRPPEGEPVLKFVSRDTFRVEAVPVLRREAR